MPIALRRELRRRKTGTLDSLVFDIFGFESPHQWFLEQLCINYANEKLQQKFTNDNSSRAVSGGAFEGIASTISVTTTQDVLEPIESRNGLLPRLNRRKCSP
jgi:myosin-5